MGTGLLGGIAGLAVAYFAGQQFGLWQSHTYSSESFSPVYDLRLGR